jgi:hypothetical protein
MSTTEHRRPKRNVEDTLRALQRTAATWPDHRHKRLITVIALAVGAAREDAWLPAWRSRCPTFVLIAGTTPPDVTEYALASFLARYRGATLRAYKQDLLAFLRWCAARQLEPLRVQRPHLELYLRWMGDPYGNTQCCGDENERHPISCLDEE